MPQAEVVEEIKGGRFLTFRLGPEHYGLEIVKVQEIIQPPFITRVPRQPDFIRGVINLRGRIIPVIDLRLRFGLEAQAFTVHTCIVVMQLLRDKTRVDVGLIVDEVQEVMEISVGQIEPPPTFAADLATDLLFGMAKLDERVVMLVDAEKVMVV